MPGTIKDADGSYIDGYEGYDNPSPTVLALGSINFGENVVPHTWKKYLTQKDKGGSPRPDSAAIDG